ncbi:MAG TPA: hypothetical protein VGW34_04540 [Allosphingosinicella sp.]|nr:hypothetical protein [Allosphingosinicella sp.]
MSPAPTAPEDSPADLPEGDREDERRRKHRIRAGLAFGIGSAAIVAALLYANRPRKKDGES